MNKSTAKLIIQLLLIVEGPPHTVVSSEGPEPIWQSNKQRYSTFCESIHIGFWGVKD